MKENYLHSVCFILISCVVILNFFTIIPPQNVLHSVTKVYSIIDIINVDEGSKFYGIICHVQIYSNYKVVEILCFHQLTSHKIIIDPLVTLYFVVKEGYEMCNLGLLCNFGRVDTLLFK